MGVILQSLKVKTPGQYANAKASAKDVRTEAAPTKFPTE